jgi:hypothetical protein
LKLDLRCTYAAQSYLVDDFSRADGAASIFARELNRIGCTG